eukprot:TRINITY_DN7450_c0_g2_i1.p1 TRINITY_DN7450_c0_g2~~TRINITY_DN7450_c0_g2_i1.p1  ORF type:complete len:512 (+),score=190.48 TRINITY_DN7450_c0_g2_i1:73-1608(+)
MHIKCAVGRRGSEQKYQIDRVLGEGAFGVVYEASSLRSDAKVAMKELPTASAGGIDATVLRELSLMRHLEECPNVPRIFGVLPSPNGENTVIMMELLDLDLERWLDRARALPQDAFEIRHVKLLLYQLLGALYWMHMSGVLHTDVKLANLLLYKDCFLKLCDLGECAVTGERRFRRNGTFLQCAPELLLTTCPYGPPADVWNVGLIFQQLLAALHRKDVLASPEEYDFTTESVLKKLVAVAGLPEAGIAALHAPHPPPNDSMNSSNESAADISGDLKDFGEFDLSTVESFTAALEDMLQSHGAVPAFDWGAEWGVDADAADLLAQLLQFSPTDRIGVADALQHPFFTDDAVFMREVQIMGVAVDLSRPHPIFTMPDAASAPDQLQELLETIEASSNIDVDAYYHSRRSRIGKMLVSPLVVPEDVTRTAATVSAMIVKRTSWYRRSSGFGDAEASPKSMLRKGLSTPGMRRNVTFSDGLDRMDSESVSPLGSPESGRGVMAMPRSRSIVTLA